VRFCPSEMEEIREIHEPFDQAFENSFDSDYLDPHDAVAFYAWQLSAMLASGKSKGHRNGMERTVA
jgi:hypothetical protein